MCILRIKSRGLKLTSSLHLIVMSSMLFYCGLWSWKFVNNVQLLWDATMFFLFPSSFAWMCVCLFAWIHLCFTSKQNVSFPVWIWTPEPSYSETTHPLASPGPVPFWRLYPILFLLRLGIPISSEAPGYLWTLRGMLGCQNRNPQYGKLLDQIGETSCIFSSCKCTLRRFDTLLKIFKKFLKLSFFFCKGNDV